MKFTLSFLLVSTLSFSLQAKTDNTQNLYGVTLNSYKVDSNRTYTGTTEKNYPFPIALVKNGITNFTEICNNDFKSWRKFTPSEADCKYHNEHLVETFVVEEKLNRYLIGKRIYNRGSSNYYELVEVKESKNLKNQKTITVQFNMLTDQEVKAFTSPKFSNDSAFDKSSTTFVLTEVSPYQTHLTYNYTAETDHWLLNKEVTVPQVFASISKSINNLLKTVEAESSYQKRKLASEN